MTESQLHLITFNNCVCLSFMQLRVHIWMEKKLFSIFRNIKEHFKSVETKLVFIIEIVKQNET